MEAQHPTLMEVRSVTPGWPQPSEDRCRLNKGWSQELVWW